MAEYIKKEDMRKALREQERLRGLKGLGWVEAAMDKLPTLTPPNEWVSVEERLPEVNGEYIVHACDEGCSHDEVVWGGDAVVCAEYYSDSWTWYEGTAEYDISDIVTHWMPLPEPPNV